MKLYLISLLAGLSGLYITSIYTHHFTTLNDSELHLSQFPGKKLLLVNIASGSEKAATQLPQLEQLYQQYNDSLIVLAFPSNDFGNEPRTDSSLKLLLQNTYHITFPVSKKIGVKDSLATLHPLYSWLQHKNQNSNSDIKVKADFQKYLIDRDGIIIGIFSSTTNPMDSSIIQAITQ